MITVDDYFTIKNIFTVSQNQMVDSIVHSEAVRHNITELAMGMICEYRVFRIESRVDYIIEIVQDELSIMGIEFGNNTTFDLNEYRQNQYYFAEGVKSYIGRVSMPVSKLTALDDESRMYYHKGFLSAMEQVNSEPSPEHDLYVKIFIEGDRYMEDNVFEPDMVIR